MLDKDILERLNSVTPEEWEQAIIELTSYALFLVKFNKTWRAGGIPRGHTAESIAMEAINTLLEGIRIWNPTKTPELINFLKSAVKSIVSDLYTLKENQHITKSFIEDDNGVIVEELQEKHDTLSEHGFHIAQQQPQTPEGALLEREKADNNKIIFEAILEAIKGEEDLEELALIMWDGHTKPREIAKEMGKDIEYVYNLRKKFFRRIDEFNKGVLKDRTNYGP